MGRCVSQMPVMLCVCTVWSLHYSESAVCSHAWRQVCSEVVRYYSVCLTCGLQLRHLPCHMSQHCSHCLQRDCIRAHFTAQTPHKACIMRILHAILHT